MPEPVDGIIVGSKVIIILVDRLISGKRIILEASILLGACLSVMPVAITACKFCIFENPDFTSESCEYEEVFVIS